MSRTLALLVCMALCCSVTDGLAQKKKASRKPVTLRGKKAKRSKKKSATKSQKLPALKTAADKQKFLEVIRESMPTRRVSTKIRYMPADLDHSLEYRVGRDSDFAPLINDERFVRRIHLDLIGRPPSVRVVRDFVADETRSKRAVLVDQLMKTEQFARKWARYWKNVIFYESTAARSRTNPQA
ncbi:MAG: DUF1549 domain-containing protein, partial [Planctomycetaceae bacterium]